MRIRIFITLVLAILLVIFTIQNSEIVAIKLFFWKFEITEALLIIFCIIIGLLIGLLIPKKKTKPVKKENDD
jgi:putative membrane protein